MNDYNMNNGNQQRDIVLSPNEFIFVQNNTNGIIKTYTGPTTITISTQDSLVYFDRRTKRFIATSDVNKAKQLMILPPENWYAVLKNPTADGTFPETGKASISPELKSGCKINITGPAAFALFPGQMAQVIKGHALRSNQYLLARVYEADQANINKGEVVDAEGNKVEDETAKYVNGQILVIKGTEISFYIPPTGIEVIPVDNNEDNGFVRDAVTLERLEYCILKDEDGNKRYVHGPKVVFPEPTETFVTSPKGGLIFRAIELSKISGIYVKVIAKYTDEKKVEHPVGEELFITGNDQMIYYPRPEHAVISYDGKMMHHAIAIPKGEGRYIMDRMTGEIKTVLGPAMYLPDPRTEVVVKRKLTRSQCSLWYPGNQDVMDYNLALTEKAVEKAATKSVSTDAFAFSAKSMDSTLASLEAKANISRGTSYTKPRTIMLDNKYDGVVAIDVWTGYAVNICSKDGTRKVVCGPETCLLDYDQTLEVMSLSTGKPKTTDVLEKTVYLRYKNNVITDIVNFETKDFVNGAVKVAYNVSFDEAQKDKWFSVENYVKFLCDKMRMLIRSAARNYTIEEFYQNYIFIVTTAVMDDEDDTHFDENGMVVEDCEVLSINVEKRVMSLLDNHQEQVLQQTLATQLAEQELAFTKRQAEVDKAQFEVNSQKAQYKMALQREEALQKVTLQGEINRKKELESQAAAEAEVELQKLKDAVAEAQRKRQQAEYDLENIQKEKEAALEADRMKAYSAMVENVMHAVTPDLVAAMSTQSNVDITKAIVENISPYALASHGETATDVVNRLLRGTPLEDVIAQTGAHVNVPMN